MIGDTSSLTEMAQDRTTDLANLATATTTNINRFNELTKTVANQSSQNISLKKEFLAATLATSKLKNEIVTIKSSNVYIGQWSGGLGDKQRNSCPRRPLDPNGYCWTHDFKVSYNHTSKACTTKKNRHKYEATRTNTMGVFNRNKHHNFE